MKVKRTFNFTIDKLYYRNKQFSNNKTILDNTNINKTQRITNKSRRMSIINMYFELNSENFVENLGGLDIP